MALRDRGEKQRFDQRILGNSEDDLVKKNLRLSGQRINIDALAQQVCKKYNISLGELRSGSRRRDVSKARGSISWIAVRELGYSGANVARYLGVTFEKMMVWIRSYLNTNLIFQSMDFIHLELTLQTTAVVMNTNMLGVNYAIWFRRQRA